MTFEDILHKFRSTSFTEKEKGTRFERIIRSWFLSDPRYNHLTDVWLWEDFPARADFGGKDTGIDLVARTELGDYWAIQCKCYAADAVISKPTVDSFLATSSRTFADPVTLRTVRFAARVWVSTTSHWGANAEEALRNQDPPVNRINPVDLATSPVDWDKLLKGIEGRKSLRSGKQPLEHQLNAISAAHRHYIEEEHARGKLIMACGTGKTYTSLKIVEALTGGHGLVLFMVPSIALLGQTLNEWSADAAKPIRAVCICSDTKASRRAMKDNEDDAILDTALDLAQPATTNARAVCRQLHSYRHHDGLVCVFSTYQSVDAVAEAQRQLLKDTDGAFGSFDFIVCDEAHRTTGVKLSQADESAFTKIHSDENVSARRRLYMTATPRLYGENAKMRASLRDCVLCSMDDEALYGTEFFRVNFSYAVQKGLLTDYKVLVLTVSERDIPADIRADVMDTGRRDLNFDDTTKLIGVINGLSKQLRGDDGMTWQVDPRMMRRAGELRMGSRFHFPGFMRGEDVRHMYAISSLYVMPSVSEPFGIAPLEALQCGVPVLMSKQSGSAEVLPSAFTVDFWNVREMADIIINILRYPEMASASLRLCQEELKLLTWERAANGILDAYARVCPNARS